MNKIDSKLEQIRNEGRIGLMGHIIAGFPDIESSYQAAMGIVEGGIDFMEIQIPFSDPTADGPTIEGACYKALASGFKVKDGFALLRKITSSCEIPVLIMTYGNIVYKYGVQKFIEDVKNNGGAGVIIPDIPVESDENLNKYCRDNDIKNIMICAPTTTDQRLKKLSSRGTGFIYTILREGTTGAITNITEQSIERIQKIKSICKLPIAVGFGIRSSEQIKALKGHADIAIAGSYFVKVIEEVTDKPVIKTDDEMAKTEKQQQSSSSKSSNKSSTKSSTKKSTKNSDTKSTKASKSDLQLSLKKATESLKN